MSDRRPKLEKLRTLAQRGATEGERAAARAAISRLQVSEPRQTIRGNHFDRVTYDDQFMAEVVRQFSRDAGWQAARREPQRRVEDSPLYVGDAAERARQMGFVTFS